MLNITLDLLEQIGDVAKRAGQEIMNIYETDFAVEAKADSSPVTEADKAAEALIIRSIREGITDKFPIVGEESFAAGAQCAPGHDDHSLLLECPRRKSLRRLASWDRNPHIHGCLGQRGIEPGLR